MSSTFCENVNDVWCGDKQLTIAFSGAGVVFLASCVTPLAYLMFFLAHRLSYTLTGQIMPEEKRREQRLPLFVYWLIRLVQACIYGAGFALLGWAAFRCLFDSDDALPVADPISEDTSIAHASAASAILFASGIVAAFGVYYIDRPLQTITMQRKPTWWMRMFFFFYNLTVWVVYFGGWWYFAWVLCYHRSPGRQLFSALSCLVTGAMYRSLLKAHEDSHEILNFHGLWIALETTIMRRATYFLGLLGIACSLSLHALSSTTDFDDLQWAALIASAAAVLGFAILWQELIRLVYHMPPYHWLSASYADRQPESLRHGEWLQLSAHGGGTSLVDHSMESFPDQAPGPIYSIPPQQTMTTRPRGTGTGSSKWKELAFSSEF